MFYLNRQACFACYLRPSNFIHSHLNFQPMATPLTYAFNRERLLKLINRPGCATVVFSLVNLIKKPHTEAYMYIYVQAHDDAGEPIRSQDILPDGEEGCPVPPGWKCDLTPPPITPGQLELVPRFSMAKSDLLPLVEQNEFEMIGTDEHQKEVMMNQVLADLEAEMTADGMEPVLAFHCLGKTRIPKLAGKKATAFTPSMKPVPTR